MTAGWTRRLRPLWPGSPIRSQVDFEQVDTSQKGNDAPAAESPADPAPPQPRPRDETDARLIRLVSQSASVRASLAWERSRRAALEQALLDVQTRESEQRTREHDQCRQIEALRRDIEDLRRSTSWRLSAPVRRIGELSQVSAQGLRRSVRVAKWVLTGQLRASLRLRRLALQQQPSPVNPAAEPPDLCAVFVSLFGDLPIHFPAVDDPTVSVIIPCFKGLTDVETCLRSLVRSLPSEPSFEVILVDDCPDEPVIQAISASPGLTKIANPENLGFLLTSNRGAANARGRFLCFLNSDTIVQPGWLTALVEAVEAAPKPAIAGGMLLNRDGTIQDAGWRILGSGWGLPIGRDADPDDGAYTYRRSVDCVTGACMLLPAALFRALDGLDPFFAPAFYEEFDLDFRAMRKGGTVIYEPRSKVIHIGSASYGVARRDELSIINHRKFIARFADEISRRPWTGGGPFEQRAQPGDGPVVLVLEDHLPRPDRSAGDLTIASYLNLMAQAGFRVVFGSLSFDATGDAALALERQGIELIRPPRTVKAWLQDHGRHVDLILMARPHVAENLLEAIRAHTSAKVAYYTHDLHHLRLQRQAETSGSSTLQAGAESVKVRELAVFRAVDVVLSPSTSEKEIIETLVPAKPVLVMPPFFYQSENICCRDEAHFATCHDILFVGGFEHEPNIDAAEFIAREVMPLVWQQEPDARLLLVGYDPPSRVLSLANRKVTVTGHVPSIEPYMGSARVFLAALRYGAGVKGKTVQALQRGVPVVATPIGAEGIGIEPDRDALIANDAQGLAEAVLSLLSDPAKCAALSRSGADLVRGRFSRRSSRLAIESLVDRPRCPVCGSARLLPAAEDHAPVCGDCLATAANTAVARAVLRHMALDAEQSLAELVRGRRDLRLFEFAATGPIAATLRGWPGFSTVDTAPAHLPYPQLDVRPRALPRHAGRPAASRPSPCGGPPGASSGRRPDRRGRNRWTRHDTGRPGTVDRQARTGPPRRGERPDRARATGNQTGWLSLTTRFRSTYHRFSWDR